jgi:hypothetical protein
MTEVWIRGPGGELVRVDAIVCSLCGDEGVEATCLNGLALQVAGPGCPGDYDRQLLAELA